MKQLLNRLFVMILMMSSMNYLDAMMHEYAATPHENSTPFYRGTDSAPSNSKDIPVNHYGPTAAYFKSLEEYQSRQAEIAASKNKNSSNDQLDVPDIVRRYNETVAKPIQEQTLDLSEPATSQNSLPNKESQTEVTQGTVLWVSKPQPKMPQTIVDAKKTFSSTPEYDTKGSLETLNYKNLYFDGPFVEINYALATQRPIDSVILTDSVTGNKKEYELTYDDSIKTWSTAQIPQRDYLVLVKYYPESGKTQIIESKYNNNSLLPKLTLIQESWYDQKGQNIAKPKTTYETYKQVSQNIMNGLEIAQRNLPEVQKQLEEFKADPTSYAIQQGVPAVRQILKNYKENPGKPIKAEDQLLIKNLAQDILKEEAGIEIDMNQPIAPQAANISVEMALKTIEEYIESPSQEQPQESILTPENQKRAKIVVNKVARKGLAVAKEQLTKPQQEFDPSTDVLWESASKESAIDFGNVVAEKLIDTAQNYAENINKPTENNNSQSIWNDTVRQKADTLLTTSADKINETMGLPDTTRQFNRADNVLPENAILFTSTITPEIIAKLGVPQKDSTATQAADIPVQTKTITDSIVAMFRSSAQALAKTPEGLRSLANQISSAVSYLCGYPPEIMVRAQPILNEAIQQATNKNGLEKSKNDAEFNKRYTSWSGQLITKLCNTVGKEAPEDIQTVLITGESDDPLSPSISIVYNSRSNTFKSGFIVYDGQRYQIDPNNFKPDSSTGKYTITNPLFNKATQQNFLQKQVDKTIKNTTSSWYSPDKSTNDLVKAWAEYTDAKLTGQGIDGKITVEFDPKNPKNITQEVTKTAPDVSTITTKSSTSGKQVKLEGDISTPTIDIQLDAQDNLQSMDVSFNNVVTGATSKASQQAIEFDKNTGIYTITALFELPSEEKLTGLKALQETYQTIKNQIYPTIVNAVSESYGLTNAKHNDPKTKAALNETAKWLLEPVATAMQKVVVTYDPAAKQFTSTATKIMSQGSTVTQSYNYTM
jgi:hypothetical protein